MRMTMMTGVAALVLALAAPLAAADCQADRQSCRSACDLGVVLGQASVAGEIDTPNKVKRLEKISEKTRKDCYRDCKTNFRCGKGDDND